MQLATFRTRLESGELSARALTEAFLAKSVVAQNKYNLYITETHEQARATADLVDRQRRRGAPLPPLAGIPVALKDNILTQGIPTTLASQIMAKYIPPYDAGVAGRLELCPLVGKANMDEFAMGSSNETSAYGPVRNPRDAERVPGGSSGGSAAAVACGSVPFALGSDTGGSIRQPAALCGVTALRPTYGLVSRWGLAAFASSIDQVGPITRSVADLAPVLQAIAGHDPRDATSSRKTPPDYAQFLQRNISGLRIGIIDDAFDDGLDAETGDAVLAASEILSGSGALLSRVNMGLAKEAVAAYHVIASVEAASNLARYDGVRYGFRGQGQDLREQYLHSRIFGHEVRRRILLGTWVLAGEGGDCFQRAQAVRARIEQRFAQLFGQVDALLLPTAPGPAFLPGEKQDPLSMYLSDYYTIPASLAGVPALTVPCGLSHCLPVGMQLVAPAYQEGVLLSLGHAWQSLSDWHYLPEVV